MRGMSARVYLNGVIVAPDEARISIFDRGFLYGDSVYETMRVYGGVPFALAAHLERLVSSGRRVAFQLPWDTAALATAVHETLAAAQLGDAYLRVIATRGSGPMGLDPALAVAPQLIVIVMPLPELPESWYTQGRSAALVSVMRNVKQALDPQAKTGNYMNSVMAVEEARRRGADEAIMLDMAGRVAEASSANVFVRLDDGWLTPPLEVGILGGITRHHLIEICREAALAVAERMLWPADLQRASEILLCSSVRELLPVVRLDGEAVGDGRVGPATQALRALYRARVHQACGIG